MTLPPSAPPALAQIAQQFVQTSSGVVAFRLHRTMDVHAGFEKRHEDLVLNGIYQNGTIVKVRVSNYTIDGRPASASDVAAVEQAWGHPKPGEAFAPPFDPQYVSDYQYQSAGPSTIDFSSNMHDAGHGNGTFSFDTQANVVTCSYQPNVLPPHANSGEITDRRAEVLPQYWAVTQETQEYKGSYGPFAGAGTVELDFSDFRRFPDVQSALVTL
jgi:hypothetical protein